MPKYVILKSFRHANALRLPGEIIELTPARAQVLRSSGLIGTEYVPPPKEPLKEPEKESGVKAEEPKPSAKKGKAGK